MQRQDTKPYLDEITEVIVLSMCGYYLKIAIGEKPKKKELYLKKVLRKFAVKLDYVERNEILKIVNATNFIKVVDNVCRAVLGED